MKVGWITLVLLTGTMLPIQAAVNARLRTFVENPLYSALISFGVGSVALMAVSGMAAIQGQVGNLRGAFGAPWWAWIGGAFGALFVTMAILAVPRIGAAGYSGAVITGQLFGALLLDHYGWLGLPQHSISSTRLAGAVLLLFAVWLIQR